MANGWTPERRARQAELIRSWKPWSRSTGPRTDAGKATASQNRQKSLGRAYDAVEQARRDLMEAARKQKSAEVSKAAPGADLLALKNLILIKGNQPEILPLD